MSQSQEDIYRQSVQEKGFSLVRLVAGNRAFVLLFALIIQILLSGPDMGGILVDIIAKMATIVAVVFVASDNRKHLYGGLSLGVPALILVILSNRSDNEALDWISYSVVLVLYIYIIRLMLRKIFNAKVITANTIGLALCTYILIGAIWVLFYTPVAVLDPDAFSVPIHQGPGSFHTLTYFSYVTLTTLGYGDISPVSNLARNLAVIEAVTGTLFLAVLISRLVGSFRSTGDQ